jgi:hypothetical protein
MHRSKQQQQTASSFDHLVATSASSIGSTVRPIAWRILFHSIPWQRRTMSCAVAMI